MVESDLGTSRLYRLRMIRIFIKRVCHTTMTLAQVEYWHNRANSPDSKKRYQWIHSGNHRRSGIADRDIEARKSLIRWQLSYSTPLAFFFFFGRACSPSNIRTAWISLPLPTTGSLSTAGGSISSAACSTIAGGGGRRFAVGSTRIGSWFWKTSLVPRLEIGSPTSLGWNDASSWVLSSSPV
jgi:hypothetical protein